MTDFTTATASTSFDMDGATTIEIGRAGWRSGINVQLDDIFTGPLLRMIISSAFESAGANLRHPRSIAQPGWWAHVIAGVADHYTPTKIQKHHQRAKTNVVVLVDDDRMGERPAWPRVKFAPQGHYYDLRSEQALAHGPSTIELTQYREVHNLHKLTNADILRQFEQGVLEWMSGEPKPNHLRGIRAAGS